MILYGVVANVSITSLFMAGIIPGMVVGLMLILTAYGLARRAGYKASDRRYTSREFVACFRRSFWSLMSPVIVLGGIYGGIFTPVEASCVAVVYAIVIGGLVNRKLKWQDFVDCVNNTNLVVSTMVVVVGVSVLFGRFLTMYQVPQKATMVLLGLTDDPYTVLYLIITFLFVLGMFMDTLATIVILGPILLPVITHFGIDPVFFGVLWVMANEIALLSPPLGPNVFIAMNLTGISLERASKAIIPYTLVLAATIFFMVRFGEDLILFLPRLFGR
jgi:C4-dicarboxylate transporter DctM subunit